MTTNELNAQADILKVEAQDKLRSILRIQSGGDSNFMDYHNANRVVEAIIGAAMLNVMASIKQVQEEC